MEWSNTLDASTTSGMARTMWSGASSRGTKFLFGQTTLRMMKWLLPTPQKMDYPLSTMSATASTMRKGRSARVSIQGSTKQNMELCSTVLSKDIVE